jgi:hypothetical protein
MRGRVYSYRVNANATATIPIIAKTNMKRANGIQRGANTHTHGHVM